MLSVDVLASRLLLDLLPSVVHVDTRQGGAWMAATLALTTEELTHVGPEARPSPPGSPTSW